MRRSLSSRGRTRGGFADGNIQPKVIGSRRRVAQILGPNKKRGSVLPVQESWQPQNAIAVGACRVTAKSESENFESRFLLLTSEARHSPEHLIFAGRSRHNCIRGGHLIAGLENSQPTFAIMIQIQVKMSYGGDRIFGAFPAVRPKRIGTEMDVRTFDIFMGQPA